jgi:F0F1-type ATP synthase membrane subunit c/vacuolar-type H+-ATPase subunit K
VGVGGTSVGVGVGIGVGVGGIGVAVGVGGTSVTVLQLAPKISSVKRQANNGFLILMPPLFEINGLGVETIGNAC